MRTITLSKAGIARTMKPVPGTDGWVAVAGVDLDARKKVFIFLEGPAAQAAREAADENGGVHVLVTDEQVVASLPMEEDGPS